MVFFFLSIGTDRFSSINCYLTTNFNKPFSGPILNEKVTIKQWIGILLGFTGSIFVLGFDLGKDIPIQGLIATIVALITITSSTIWQKKLGNKTSLVVNNFYQTWVDVYSMF